MGKYLFILFFISSWPTNNAAGRYYSFTYKVFADNTDTSQNVFLPIERHTQSFVLRNFFDGLVISGLANKDTILCSFKTKFQPKPGTDFIDSIKRTDSLFATSYMHIDSNVIGNMQLIDKHKNESYRIQPYPQMKVVCQDLEYYDFKKTNETKIINGWLCYKWVPAVDLIKDAISFWVCDTIPPEVSFNKYSDSFKGGLVRIEVANGIAYQLLEYKALGEPYILPIPSFLKCSTNMPSALNSVYELIYGKRGIEFKYKFDSQESNRQ